MVLVAAAAGLVFYLDRQTVAILKTTISQALGLTNADFALLISAYMVPYTACYLVSGRVLDRWGTRRGATAFLGLMAVATLGCGLANSLNSLMIARGLLGIAESGISPAIVLMFATWVPPARRALAMTGCQAIQALAPVTAPPLVAGLALRGEWRMAFFLPALLSVGAAILWWTSDRAPSVRPTAAGGATQARLSWREAVRLIFSQRPLRALILARIVSDPFYFFLNNWHTGFLQEHAGWSLQEIGRLTWIPWVFVPLASMGVAVWSDRRARATGDPASARRAPLCGLALLAPAAALAPFLAGTGPVVLGLVTLSLVMTSCWVTMSGVMVSELAPAGTIATTIGILSALSGCASIAFNQAAGFLVDALGYTALFVAGACLHPIAAFILWRSQQGAAAAALPTRIGSLSTP